MTSRCVLTTRAPFHLEATVRVLQRRPTNRVDVWEQGRYRRVLTVAGACVFVEVENCGTLDEPEVRVTRRSGEPSTATDIGVSQAVRRILGLDVDPESLQHLAGIERVLHSTVIALRGLRPPRFENLFEAFASVVPFQQLSLDAGVAIVGRFVERFGRHIEVGGRRFYAFPTPQVIAQARLQSLRSCGLSSQKAHTVRSLARTLASGELTEEMLCGMSTSESLRTLTELPGIGPWSAALVLLRGLGRLDVFPPGDVGAARGLRTLLRLDSGSPLEPVIERFGAYRGYLYFCALGGSLLTKGLIHAAPHLDRTMRER